ncbi:MAG TPA: type I-E CRISPR-associated protein Cas7/Cse4/CasC [Anaerolineae bacterium]|nr:type I-E CRISPR-associated protein Cas7/Cse4/CasC [Anaerolineae bacterium]
MFIELHIIQNFAPSNLNRDDTGNPKEAEFGGVRRARISSQAIKRAIRSEPIFAETTQVEPGVRTRLLARKLTEKLMAAGKSEEDAQAVALAFAEAFSGKMDGERTSVLIYLSPQELQEMAELLTSHWEAIVVALAAPKDKKAQKDNPLPKLVKDFLKRTKNRTSAPDIALFGRMLADKPDLNLDAASQVAHALSTHRVNMEIDFFTAVDDLQPKEETGAGMMGVTGYNSATYYRYARIDWKQLVDNLDGDESLARRTVEGFLLAALRAIPTGKQNSFAAQNPPSFALAVTRTDGMSWSLVNAFEKPVRPARDGGYVEPSVQKLEAYWQRLVQFYGGDDATPQVLNIDGVELDVLAHAQQPNVQAWIASILNALPCA